MRRTLLATTLLLSGLTQADMLDGLKLYDQKDYTKAQSEFSSLLPLGNELAAFNLAVMHYKGQGIPVDLVKAQAYFQLAAELGDSRAAGLASSVSAKLTTTEQQLAAEQFHSLLSKVQIRDLLDGDFDQPDMPEVISRKEPAYPEDAIRSRAFGYSILKFIIDETGNVTTVEVLGSFPAKTFDKASVKAIKSWKYAATGKKHSGKVMMHYSTGPLQKEQVTRFMQEHKLMDYAVAGSPQHQFLLGTLLDMVATNSSYNVKVDKTLPQDPSAELPEAFFKEQPAINVAIEGFFGSAEVKTDAEGKIIEVLKTNKLSQKQATAVLLGKELDEDASNGYFSLWADPGKKVTVQAIASVSELHSGAYWWTIAAKNGNLEAQRQLAMMSESWENYLLQANDPQVQAWNGVRQILKGNKAEGQLLLDKAIAQNYQVATELKAVL